MIGAEIRGLIELQQKVDQVVTDLHGRRMLDGMRSAATMVSTDAKRLAPVDTGRLRSSIVPEIRAQGETVLGVVGSNLLYAPYLETGTKPFWPPPSALQTWARRHGVNAFVVARAISKKGIKPRHYMQNAFDQNQAEIRRIIGGVVGDIINL
jgi:HK97 gp10 family phage protein